MAMKKHRNLQPESNADDAGNTSCSTPRSTGALKLIRNPAYHQPEPHAGGGGRGSLSMYSEGKVNDGEARSRTSDIVRRPYLKPAFRCDAVFSRALVQPAKMQATT